MRTLLVFTCGFGAALVAAGCASSSPSPTSTATPTPATPAPSTATDRPGSPSTANDGADHTLKNAIANRIHTVDSAALSCLQGGPCVVAAADALPAESAGISPVLRRTRMGVSLDLDVSRVVETPTPLLTTEGDGPANHAQFPLADLPARLRTLAPADRKVALAGAADAVVARARSLAPAFGVVDRVDRIGQRVGMKSDALRHLATDVLASTDSRVDALKLHPSDLPGVLWRATSTTKIGPLTGPLFRGTPAPVKGAVSACFLTGPGRDGIVWTSGEHEARTGAEQAARISAAACAAALVRAQARDQDPFVPDPIWTRAVAHLANDTAAFAVGDDAERSARAVGRLLALRQAAVGVLVATEATAPDGAALDAAATRWASPSLSPVAGAGALLNIDAAGRAAENFVALLLASALEHALAVQHGMAWTRRGREVESLQTLQRLGAKFEAGGALEVFRQVGETTVSAALLITAYDVMRGESATGQ